MIFIDNNVIVGARCRHPGVGAATEPLRHGQENQNLEMEGWDEESPLH